MGESESSAEDSDVVRLQKGRDEQSKAFLGRPHWWYRMNHLLGTFQKLHPYHREEIIGTYRDLLEIRRSKEGEEFEAEIDRALGQLLPQLQIYHQDQNEKDWQGSIRGYLLEYFGGHMTEDDIDVTKKWLDLIARPNLKLPNADIPPSGID